MRHFTRRKDHQCSTLTEISNRLLQRRQVLAPSPGTLNRMHLDHVSLQLSDIDQFLVGKDPKIGPMPCNEMAQHHRIHEAEGMIGNDDERPLRRQFEVLRQFSHIAMLHCRQHRIEPPIQRLIARVLAIMLTHLAVGLPKPMEGQSTIHQRPHQMVETFPKRCLEVLA